MKCDLCTNDDGAGIHYHAFIEDASGKKISGREASCPHHRCIIGALYTLMASGKDALCISAT